MTDRERLIELIGSNSFCPNGITHCHQCRYYDVTRVPVCDGIAAIADYLIANGVTVLPVPVGSTVYALYNRNTSRHGAQLTTNKNLEMAKIRGVNIEIREKKANKQDALLLGRLVFLTREEAEMAIANDVSCVPVCDGVAAIADYLIANGGTVAKPEEST